MIQLQLQKYTAGTEHISLYVPDPSSVQQTYLQQKQINTATPFPYWTKVWPAAIAMSSFIQEHKNYVQDKKVLELAGGLGMPSIVAAKFAKEVHYSDYLPEAIEVVKESIRYHELDHITTSVLDWHHLPENLHADVLLLSDINYEPEAFEQLYRVIKNFIEKGTLVILSTPQRLMGKAFIEKLLQWCIYQEEQDVFYDGNAVTCSVYLLKLY